MNFLTLSLLFYISYPECYSAVNTLRIDLGDCAKPPVDGGSKAFFFCGSNAFF